MPLPDERPRASVANLIGRFENQTKRVPSSGPLPGPGASRSSSVVSHTTGDAAKEEVKEKREWPPKPFATNDKPPVILPSYIRPPPPPQPAKVPSPPPTPIAIPNTPTIPVDDYIPETVEVEPATPRPSQSQRQDNLDAPPLTKTKSAASTRTSIATKARAVASNPAKTPIKSPGQKQSLAPSTIQPLKPQHTGQSVTSTTSVRKSVTRPPIPSTPSRSKTPSKPLSSVANSKSPPSRPKTPSTGLFAPTAASLARSRTAQPQLPTPTKKPTLSSSSADRLSKPTAASLSKARAPPTASPASAPRSPSNRGSSKPKIAALGTKATPVSKAKAGDAMAGPGDPDNHSGKHEEVEQTQETIADATTQADPIEDTSVGLLSESTIDLSIQVGEPCEPEEEFSDREESKQSPMLSSLDTNDTLIDTEVDEKMEEPKSFKSAGNDIEDIVNLLETNALPKLHSETATGVPNIPDEVHDIPDEE